MVTRSNHTKSSVGTFHATCFGEGFFKSGCLQQYRFRDILTQYIVGVVRRD